MGVETYICCDKCGKGRVFDGTMGKTEAIIIMRNRGWSVGKRWLCPDCKRRKKVKSDEE